MGMWIPKRTFFGTSPPRRGHSVPPEDGTASLPPGQNTLPSSRPFPFGRGPGRWGWLAILPGSAPGGSRSHCCCRYPGCVRYGVRHGIHWQRSSSRRHGAVVTCHWRGLRDRSGHPWHSRHTSPGTTPKRCRACHRGPVRWVCRSPPLPFPRWLMIQCLVSSSMRTSVDETPRQLPVRSRSSSSSAQIQYR